MYSPLQGHLTRCYQHLFAHSWSAKGWLDGQPMLWGRGLAIPKHITKPFLFALMTLCNTSIQASWMWSDLPNLIQGFWSRLLHFRDRFHSTFFLASRMPMKTKWISVGPATMFSGNLEKTLTRSYPTTMVRVGSKRFTTCVWIDVRIYGDGCRDHQVVPMFFLWLSGWTDG